MQEVTLKQLLEAGCHFGHKSERWHPKAAEFIYQKREGIHVIDLAKTKIGLVKAAEFIKSLTSKGKKVLFVGTKRQAAAIVREEATRVGAPYIVQRWIGGFLTNWTEVHKNLEKIRKLTEEEKTDAWKIYPKHERVQLARYLRKLEVFYGGVIELYELPEAVFVIDIKRESIVINEARKMNLPVVGIVDTNSDPSKIDYVIPANDDAVGSIKFIVTYLTDAYLEGKNEFEKNIQDNKIKDSKIVDNKTGSQVNNKTVRQENSKMLDNKTLRPEDSKTIKPEVKKETVVEKKVEQIVKKTETVKPVKTEVKETKSVKTEKK